MVIKIIYNTRDVTPNGYFFFFFCHTILMTFDDLIRIYKVDIQWNWDAQETSWLWTTILFSNKQHDISVKRFLSVAIVVFRFFESKIIHAATTCLSSGAVSGEIPVVLPASKHWIYVFSFLFVICFIYSAFFCARCVIRWAAV